MSGTLNRWEEEFGSFRQEVRNKNKEVDNSFETYTQRILALPNAEAPDSSFLGQYYKRSSQDALDDNFVGSSKLNVAGKEEYRSNFGVTESPTLTKVLEHYLKQGRQVNTEWFYMDDLGLAKTEGKEMLDSTVQLYKKYKNINAIVSAAPDTTRVTNERIQDAVGKEKINIYKKNEHKPPVFHNKAVTVAPTDKYKGYFRQDTGSIGTVLDVFGNTGVLVGRTELFYETNHPVIIKENEARRQKLLKGDSLHISQYTLAGKEAAYTQIIEDIKNTSGTGTIIGHFASMADIQSLKSNKNSSNDTIVLFYEMLKLEARKGRKVIITTPDKSNASKTMLKELEESGVIVSSELKYFGNSLLKTDSAILNIPYLGSFLKDRLRMATAHYNLVIINKDKDDKESISYLGTARPENEYNSKARVIENVTRIPSSLDPNFARYVTKFTLNRYNFEKSKSDIYAKTGLSDLIKLKTKHSDKTIQSKEGELPYYPTQLDDSYYLAGHGLKLPYLRTFSHRYEYYTLKAAPTELIQMNLALSRGSLRQQINQAFDKEILLPDMNIIGSGLKQIGKGIDYLFGYYDYKKNLQEAQQPITGSLGSLLQQQHKNYSDEDGTFATLMESIYNLPVGSAIAVGTYLSINLPLQHIKGSLENELLMSLFQTSSLNNKRGIGARAANIAFAGLAVGASSLLGETEEGSLASFTNSMLLIGASVFGVRSVSRRTGNALGYLLASQNIAALLQQTEQPYLANTVQITGLALTAHSLFSTDKLFSRTMIYGRHQGAAIDLAIARAETIAGMNNREVSTALVSKELQFILNNAARPGDPVIDHPNYDPNNNSDDIFHPDRDRRIKQSLSNQEVKKDILELGGDGASYFSMIQYTRSLDKYRFDAVLRPILEAINPYQFNSPQYQVFNESINELSETIGAKPKVRLVSDQGSPTIILEQVAQDRIAQMAKSLDRIGYVLPLNIAYWIPGVRSALNLTDFNPQQNLVWTDVFSMEKASHWVNTSAKMFSGLLSDRKPKFVLGWNNILGSSIELGVNIAKSVAEAIGGIGSSIKRAGELYATANKLYAAHEDVLEFYNQRRQGISDPNLPNIISGDPANTQYQDMLRQNYLDVLAAKRSAYSDYAIVLEELGSSNEYKRYVSLLEDINARLNNHTAHYGHNLNNDKSLDVNPIKASSNQKISQHARLIIKNKDYGVDSSTLLRVQRTKNVVQFIGMTLLTDATLGWSILEHTVNLGTQIKAREALKDENGEQYQKFRLTPDPSIAVSAIAGIMTGSLIGYIFPEYEHSSEGTKFEAVDEAAFASKEQQIKRAANGKFALGTNSDVYINTANEAKQQEKLYRQARRVAQNLEYHELKFNKKLAWAGALVGILATKTIYNTVSSFYSNFVFKDTDKSLELKGAEAVFSSLLEEGAAQLQEEIHFYQSKGAYVHYSSFVTLGLLHSLSRQYLINQASNVKGDITALQSYEAALAYNNTLADPAEFEPEYARGFSRVFNIATQQPLPFFQIALLGRYAQNRYSIGVSLQLAPVTGLGVNLNLPISVIAKDSRPVPLDRSILQQYATQELAPEDYLRTTANLLTGAFTFGSTFVYEENNVYVPAMETIGVFGIASSILKSRPVNRAATKIFMSHPESAMTTAINRELNTIQELASNSIVKTIYSISQNSLLDLASLPFQFTYYSYKSIFKGSMAQYGAIGLAAIAAGSAINSYYKATGYEYVGVTSDPFDDVETPEEAHQKVKQTVLAMGAISASLVAYSISSAPNTARLVKTGFKQLFPYYLASSLGYVVSRPGTTFVDGGGSDTMLDQIGATVGIGFVYGLGLHATGVFADRKVIAADTILRVAAMAQKRELDVEEYARKYFTYVFNNGRPIDDDKINNLVSGFKKGIELINANEFHTVVPEDTDDLFLLRLRDKQRSPIIRINSWAHEEISAREILDFANRGFIKTIYVGANEDRNAVLKKVEDDLVKRAPSGEARAIKGRTLLAFMASTGITASMLAATTMSPKKIRNSLYDIPIVRETLKVYDNSMVNPYDEYKPSIGGYIGKMLGRFVRGLTSLFSSPYTDKPDPFISTIGPYGYSLKEAPTPYAQWASGNMDFSISSFVMGRKDSKDIETMLYYIYSRRRSSGSKSELELNSYQELLTIHRGWLPRESPAKMQAISNYDLRYASEGTTRALRIREYFTQHALWQKPTEIQYDLRRMALISGIIQANPIQPVQYRWTPLATLGEMNWLVINPDNTLEVEWVYAKKYSGIKKRTAPKQISTFDQYVADNIYSDRLASSAFSPGHLISGLTQSIISSPTLAPIAPLAGALSVMLTSLTLLTSGASVVSGLASAATPKDSYSLLGKSYLYSGRYLFDPQFYRFKSIDLNGQKRIVQLDISKSLDRGNLLPLDLSDVKDIHSLTKELQTSHRLILKTLNTFFSSSFDKIVTDIVKLDAAELDNYLANNRDHIRNALRAEVKLKLKAELSKSLKFSKTTSGVSSTVFEAFFSYGKDIDSFLDNIFGKTLDNVGVLDKILDEVIQENKVIAKSTFTSDVLVRRKGASLTAITNSIFTRELVNAFSNVGGSSINIPISERLLNEKIITPRQARLDSMFRRHRIGIPLSSESTSHGIIKSLGHAVIGSASLLKGYYHAVPYYESIEGLSLALDSSQSRNMRQMGAYSLSSSVTYSTLAMLLAKPLSVIGVPIWLSGLLVAGGLLATQAMMSQQPRWRTAEANFFTKASNTIIDITDRLNNTPLYPVIQALSRSVNWFTREFTGPTLAKLHQQFLSPEASRGKRWLGMSLIYTNLLPYSAYTQDLFQRTNKIKEMMYSIRSLSRVGRMIDPQMVHPNLFGRPFGSREEINYNLYFKSYAGKRTLADFGRPAYTVSSLLQTDLYLRQGLQDLSVSGLGASRINRPVEKVSPWVTFGTFAAIGLGSLVFFNRGVRNLLNNFLGHFSVTVASKLYGSKTNQAVISLADRFDAVNNIHNPALPPYTVDLTDDTMFDNGVIRLNRQVAHNLDRLARGRSVPRWWGQPVPLSMELTKFTFLHEYAHLRQYQAGLFRQAQLPEAPTLLHTDSRSSSIITNMAKSSAYHYYSASKGKVSKNELQRVYELEYRANVMALNALTETEFTRALDELEVNSSISDRARLYDEIDAQSLLRSNAASLRNIDTLYAPNSQYRRGYPSSLINESQKARPWLAEQGQGGYYFADTKNRTGRMFLSGFFNMFGSIRDIPLIGGQNIHQAFQERKRASSRMQALKDPRIDKAANILAKTNGDFGSLNSFVNSLTVVQTDELHKAFTQIGVSHTNARYQHLFFSQVLSNDDIVHSLLGKTSIDYTEKGAFIKFETSLNTIKLSVKDFAEGLTRTSLTAEYQTVLDKQKRRNKIVERFNRRVNKITDAIKAENKKLAQLALDINNNVIENNETNRALLEQHELKITAMIGKVERLSQRRNAFKSKGEQQFHSEVNSVIKELNERPLAMFNIKYLIHDKQLLVALTNPKNLVFYDTSKPELSPFILMREDYLEITKSKKSEITLFKQSANNADLYEQRSSLTLASLPEVTKQGFSLNTFIDFISTDKKKAIKYLADYSQFIVDEQGTVLKDKDAFKLAKVLTSEVADKIQFTEGIRRMQNLLTSGILSFDNEGNASIINIKKYRQFAMQEYGAANLKAFFGAFGAAGSVPYNYLIQPVANFGFKTAMTLDQFGVFKGMGWTLTGLNLLRDNETAKEANRKQLQSLKLFESDYKTFAKQRESQINIETKSAVTSVAMFTSQFVTNNFFLTFGLGYLSYEKADQIAKYTGLKKRKPVSKETTDGYRYQSPLFTFSQSLRLNKDNLRVTTITSYYLGGRVNRLLKSAASATFTALKDVFTSTVTSAAKGIDNFSGAIKATLGFIAKGIKYGTLPSLLAFGEYKLARHYETLRSKWRALPESERRKYSSETEYIEREKSGYARYARAGLNTGYAVAGLHLLKPVIELTRFTARNLTYNVPSKFKPSESSIPIETSSTKPSWLNWFKRTPREGEIIKPPLLTRALMKAGRFISKHTPAWLTKKRDFIPKRWIVKTFSQNIDLPDSETSAPSPSGTRQPATGAATNAATGAAQATAQVSSVASSPKAPVDIYNWPAVKLVQAVGNFFFKGSKAIVAGLGDLVGTFGSSFTALYKKANTTIGGGVGIGIRLNRAFVNKSKSGLGFFGTIINKVGTHLATYGMKDTLLTSAAYSIDLFNLLDSHSRLTSYSSNNTPSTDEVLADLVRYKRSAFSLAAAPLEAVPYVGSLITTSLIFANNYLNSSDRLRSRAIHIQQKIQNKEEVKQSDLTNNSELFLFGLTSTIMTAGYLHSRKVRANFSNLDHVISIESDAATVRRNQALSKLNGSSGLLQQFNEMNSLPAQEVDKSKLAVLEAEILEIQEKLQPKKIGRIGNTAYDGLLTTIDNKILAREQAILRRQSILADGVNFIRRSLLNYHISVDQKEIDYLKESRKQISTISDHPSHINAAISEIKSLNPTIKALKSKTQLTQAETSQLESAISKRASLATTIREFKRLQYSKTYDGFFNGKELGYSGELRFVYHIGRAYRNVVSLLGESFNKWTKQAAATSSLTFKESLSTIETKLQPYTSDPEAASLLSQLNDLKSAYSQGDLYTVKSQLTNLSTSVQSFVNKKITASKNTVAEQASSSSNTPTNIPTNQSPTNTSSNQSQTNIRGSIPSNAPTGTNTLLKRQLYDKYPANIEINLLSHREASTPPREFSLRKIFTKLFRGDTNRARVTPTRTAHYADTPFQSSSPFSFVGAYFGGELGRYLAKSVITLPSKLNKRFDSDETSPVVTLIEPFAQSVGQVTGSIAGMSIANKVINRVNLPVLNAIDDFARSVAGSTYKFATKPIKYGLTKVGLQSLSRSISTSGTQLDLLISAGIVTSGAINLSRASTEEERLAAMRRIGGGSGQGIGSYIGAAIGFSIGGPPTAIIGSLILGAIGNYAGDRLGVAVYNYTRGNKLRNTQSNNKVVPPSVPGHTFLPPLYINPNQTNQVKRHKFFTQSQLNYMTELIWEEAKGEGNKGKAAVAASLLLRYALVKSGQLSTGTYNIEKSRSNTTIVDVINAHLQYQPYRQGKLSDANKASASERANIEGMIEGILTLGPVKYLQSLGISEKQARKIASSPNFRNKSQNVNVSYFLGSQGTLLGEHVFAPDEFYGRGRPISITHSFFGITGTGTGTVFNNSTNNITNVARVNSQPSLSIPKPKQKPSSTTNAKQRGKYNEPLMVIVNTLFANNPNKAYLLENLPNIVIDTNDYGSYHHESNTIRLQPHLYKQIHSAQTIDIEIIRVLSHELVHYAQFKDKNYKFTSNLSILPSDLRQEAKSGAQWSSLQIRNEAKELGLPSNFMYPIASGYASIETLELDAQIKSLLVIDTIAEKIQKLTPVSKPPAQQPTVTTKKPSTQPPTVTTKKPPVPQPPNVVDSKLASDVAQSINRGLEIQRRIEQQQQLTQNTNSQVQPTNTSATTRISTLSGSYSLDLKHGEIFQVGEIDANGNNSVGVSSTPNVKVEQITSATSPVVTSTQNTSSTVFNNPVQVDTSIGTNNSNTSKYIQSIEPTGGSFTYSSTQNSNNQNESAIKKPISHKFVTLNDKFKTPILDFNRQKTVTLKDLNYNITGDLNQDIAYVEKLWATNKSNLSLDARYTILNKRYELAQEYFKGKENTPEGKKTLSTLGRLSVESRVAYLGGQAETILKDASSKDDLLKARSIFMTANQIYQSQFGKPYNDFTVQTENINKVLKYNEILAAQQTQNQNETQRPSITQRRSVQSTYTPKEFSPIRGGLSTNELSIKLSNENVQEMYNKNVLRLGTSITAININAARNNINKLLAHRDQLNLTQSDVNELSRVLHTLNRRLGKTYDPNKAKASYQAYQQLVQSYTAYANFSNSRTNGAAISSNAAVLTSEFLTAYNKLKQLDPDGLYINLPSKITRGFETAKVHRAQATSNIRAYNNIQNLQNSKLFIYIKNIEDNLNAKLNFLDDNVTNPNLTTKSFLQRSTEISASLTDLTKQYRSLVSQQINRTSTGGYIIDNSQLSSILNTLNSLKERNQNLALLKLQSALQTVNTLALDTSNSQSRTKLISYYNEITRGAIEQALSYGTQSDKKILQLAQRSATNAYTVGTLSASQYYKVGNQALNLLNTNQSKNVKGSSLTIQLNSSSSYIGQYTAFSLANKYYGYANVLLNQQILYPNQNLKLSSTPLFKLKKESHVWDMQSKVAGALNSKRPSSLVSQLNSLTKQRSKSITTTDSLLKQLSTSINNFDPKKTDQLRKQIFGSTDIFKLNNALIAAQQGKPSEFTVDTSSPLGKLFQLDFQEGYKRYGKLATLLNTAYSDSWQSRAARKQAEQQFNTQFGQLAPLRRKFNVYDPESKRFITFRPNYFPWDVDWGAFTQASFINSSLSRTYERVSKMRRDDNMPRLLGIAFANPSNSAATNEFENAIYLAERGGNNNARKQAIQSRNSSRTQLNQRERNIAMAVRSLSVEGVVVGHLAAGVAYSPLTIAVPTYDKAGRVTGITQVPISSVYRQITDPNNTSQKTQQLQFYLAKTLEYNDYLQSNPTSAQVGLDNPMNLVHKHDTIQQFYNAPGNKFTVANQEKSAEYLLNYAHRLTTTISLSSLGKGMTNLAQFQANLGTVIGRSGAPNFLNFIPALFLNTPINLGGSETGYNTSNLARAAQTKSSIFDIFAAHPNVQALQKVAPNTNNYGITYNLSSSDITYNATGNLFRATKDYKISNPIISSRSYSYNGQTVNLTTAFSPITYSIGTVATFVEGKEVPKEQIESALRGLAFTDLAAAVNETQTNRPLISIFTDPVQDLPEAIALTGGNPWAAATVLITSLAFSGLRNALSTWAINNQQVDKVAADQIKFNLLAAYELLGIEIKNSPSNSTNTTSSYTSPSAPNGLTRTGDRKHPVLADPSKINIPHLLDPNDEKFFERPVDMKELLNLQSYNPNKLDEVALNNDYQVEQQEIIAKAAQITTETLKSIQATIPEKLDYSVSLNLEPNQDLSLVTSPEEAKRNQVYQGTSPTIATAEIKNNTITVSLYNEDKYVNEMYPIANGTSNNPLSHVV